MFNTMNFCSVAGALTLALALPAHAVNKCTGPDGRVSFQDGPCATGKAEKVNVSSPPLIDANAAAAARARAASAAAAPSTAPVAPTPAPTAQTQAPTQPMRSTLELEADACLNWYRPVLRDPAGAYFTSPSKEGRVLKMMIHATNGYGGYVKQEGVCEFKNGSIDEDWTKIHAKRAGWGAR